MSFFIFLLYLVITNLFPAEIFPELIPYRIPFWLGIVGLVASVLTLAPAGTLTTLSLPNGLMIGFVLSMMLSLMWAERWPGAPVFVLEKFGPSLTLFLLAIWNVTTPRRLRITGATLALLATVLAAQSVAAYHFQFMEDKLLIRGDGSQDEGELAENDAPLRVRGLGQINDPNDLALVLVATLPFLGLAWRKGRTVRNILLLGPAAVFIVYAVFLTRSRGGMVALLAVCAAALFSASRIKALLAVATLAVIFMAGNFTGGRAISTSEESAAGRLDAWSEGLDMFRSSPVLGVGFQNFTEHHDLTAHNSFVLSFAELGTIGYFFWLALLFLAILQLQQVRQCADDEINGDSLSRHARILGSSFTGTLVAAFFLSRSYNPILYLLVGLATALYRIASRDGCEVALPSLFKISRKVIALEFASILAIYVLVRVNRLFV